MRIYVGLAAALLSACSNVFPGNSAREHHFKIAESGGAYVSDISRYESLNQKSLKRSQKYRITEEGERSDKPFYLVANITQFVGGKKGDATQGTLLYVEDGSAEYDCSKWLMDRKLSESDEDTPVVSCNFKFVGVMPIPETATVKKEQSDS
jgi:hypothetical protein